MKSIGGGAMKLNGGEPMKFMGVGGGYEIDRGGAMYWMGGRAMKLIGGHMKLMGGL